MWLQGTICLALLGSFMATGLRLPVGHAAEQELVKGESKEHKTTEETSSKEAPEAPPAGDAAGGAEESPRKPEEPLNNRSPGEDAEVDSRPSGSGAGTPTPDGGGGEGAGKEEQQQQAAKEEGEARSGGSFRVQDPPSSGEGQEQEVKADQDGLITRDQLLTAPQPPPQLEKTYRISTGLGKEPSQQAAARSPEEHVSEEDLNTMFLVTGKGSSTLTPGCAFAHFTVKSRCSGNLLELALSTRDPVRGQVMLMEADETVEMNGTHMVVYGVWVGRKTPSSRAWKLEKSVHRADVQAECDRCDSMGARVILTSGSKTCAIDVSCLKKGSSRMIELEPSTLLKAYGKAGGAVGGDEGAGEKAENEDAVSNTAKTTMNIMHGDEMEGVPVSERQPLGAQMSLVISVLTRDITLDLHVSQCEARSEDGSAVVLVQDGCSASRVMGEFREVLGVVHDETFGEHTVRKVTQFAIMMAFNTKIEPQTMTVICNVKLCGGECAERPACVSSDINLGRGKRPPVPLFEKAVTLGKVFQVGGLPDEPSQEMLAMILTEKGQPRDGKPVFLFDDCVTPRTFYIFMGLLSAVYLLVLLACIYCVRRTTSKTVTKKFVDDYESPPRSLYQEYNSPRKRTPPTITPTSTPTPSPTTPLPDYLSFSLHAADRLGGRSHQN
ncbi:uncharacterized protein LOC125040842 isoform X2 [Penaeus chinensis]|uniref:uncharacterized protein LOC125040842 isoform X2 n=1 Tax=Penaeus chinensis TaxID=139456 RepID=UPI001FB74D86|nr:uncharacterized protein LOC125040842 isoform X2 [Penaeus chinensis]